MLLPDESHWPGDRGLRHGQNGGCECHNVRTTPVYAVVVGANHGSNGLLIRVQTVSVSQAGD